MTAPIANNQITPGGGLEDLQSVHQQDELPQNPELGKVSPGRERAINFCARLILACATMGISELSGVSSILEVKPSKPRINVGPQDQMIEMTDMSGKDDAYSNNIVNESVNDILHEKTDAKKKTSQVGVQSESTQPEKLQKRERKRELRSGSEVELTNIDNNVDKKELHNRIIDDDPIVDEQPKKDK